MLLNDPPELWEWTAVDQHGNKRSYQTKGPDVTESSMLEHLSRHYQNVTILSLRRCEPRDMKPPVGRVERHAFQFGIWDAAMRELGYAPKLKETIAERFRRDRLLSIAGKKPASIRNRLPSLVR